MQKNITLDYSEQNLQIGGAAFYGFRWKEKNTSNITFSYSSLQTDRDQQEETRRTSGNQIFSSTNEQTTNAIDELNGRIDNKITISERHIAEIGLGMLYYLTYNQINTIRDTVNARLMVPYLYLQDNITLFDNLIIKPGIRADFHSIPAKYIFNLVSRQFIDSIVFSG